MGASPSRTKAPCAVVKQSGYEARTKSESNDARRIRRRRCMENLAAAASDLAAATTEIDDAPGILEEIERRQEAIGSRFEDYYKDRSSSITGYLARVTASLSVCADECACVPHIVYHNMPGRCGFPLSIPLRFNEVRLAGHLETFAHMTCIICDQALFPTTAAAAVAAALQVWGCVARWRAAAAADDGACRAPPLPAGMQCKLDILVDGWARDARLSRRQALSEGRAYRIMPAGYGLHPDSRPLNPATCRVHLLVQFKPNAVSGRLDRPAAAATATAAAARATAAAEMATAAAARAMAAAAKATAAAERATSERATAAAVSWPAEQANTSSPYVVVGVPV